MKLLYSLPTGATAGAQATGEHECPLLMDGLDWHSPTSLHAAEGAPNFVMAGMLAELKTWLSSVYLCEHR